MVVEKTRRASDFSSLVRVGGSVWWAIACACMVLPAESTTGALDGVIIHSFAVHSSLPSESVNRSSPLLLKRQRCESKTRNIRANKEKNE
jgi:hypothetical protein